MAQESDPKRRKVFAPSSPRLPPASPAVSTYSDPDVTDSWWSAQHLALMPSLGHLSIAVHEMQKYLVEWQRSEKDPFWQRKSGKTVLSVLICHGESDWRVFRGMNTEVSLPAGSFCAERAAITRAASDLVAAKDISTIATLDPSDTLNPLWPCEVCQSWLSKLKAQNEEITVLAFSSTECKQFAVRLNESLLQPPNMLPSLNEVSDSPLVDLIELAEGTTDYPWDCKEVVYVDGAWNFLHPGHQQILKEAKARGSHVLVGVHSDQTLNEVFGSKSHEDFSTRFGRIIQNRNVSFVLKDAPWCISKDLIQTLCIKKVVSGSISKVVDGGKVQNDEEDQSLLDPYKIAKDFGIFEVVESSDLITEESHAHNTRKSLESRPTPC